MIKMLIMLVGLDVSTVMNRMIHQVQFSSRGRGACLAQHMSSRAGVTTSGFRSQLPVGAIQSSGRVESSVPAPVETEEVIPLEECCFSLQKNKGWDCQSWWQGDGQWGGGVGGGGWSHGRRTKDNRINHMKKCHSPTNEILTWGWSKIWRKMREQCITSGLFVLGINSYGHMLH